jgi:chorismate dehydratase
MANVRIGAPNHISVRPLIHGLQTSSRPNIVLSYGEPGELADALEDRRLDAALVPSIEFLRGVGSGFVPGPALVIKGHTGGIFLVTDRPIEQIKRIAVSVSCRTPVAALRVVLDQVHHIMPDFCVSHADAGNWRGDYDAILLSDDQGLRYGQNGNGSDAICHDVGTMWCSLHETPLVLGLWAYNDASLSDDLASLLRESRDCGMADLSLVAASIARTTSYDSEFLHRYLSGGFGYNMGTPEAEGLRRLEDYALQYRLIRRPRVEPRVEPRPAPAPMPNSLSTSPTIG